MNIKDGTRLSNGRLVKRGEHFWCTWEAVAAMCASTGNRKAEVATPNMRGTHLPVGGINSTSQPAHIVATDRLWPLIMALDGLSYILRSAIEQQVWPQWLFIALV